MKNFRQISSHCGRFLYLDEAIPGGFVKFGDFVFKKDWTVQICDYFMKQSFHVTVNARQGL